MRRWFVRRALRQIPMSRCPASSAGSRCRNTFQLIPRLLLKPGYLRPPAEPLNFIPFGVGGWLALLVISIIVFRPISFSYRAFSELRLLKLGGWSRMVPPYTAASTRRSAWRWPRAEFSRDGIY
jgi:hypothetical protein